MAKRKRKPSASQLNPEIKAIAMQLKAAGVLSKRANLRGRAVSRHVVKKVQENEWIASSNYQAVKVSKVMAERARAEGLQTIGNKIVIPKDGVSTKRLKRGIVTGLQPVPGGQIQFVVLPYETMSDFLRGLYSGEVDKEKTPKEQFAFTFFGNKSTQPFKDGRALYEWIIRYDSITNPITGSLLEDADKQYANFRLYRMVPGKWNNPAFEAGQKRKRDTRWLRGDEHEQRVQKKRKKRIGELTAFKAEQRREYDRKRKEGKWAKLKETNPPEYKRQLDMARKRADKSRNKRKK